MIELCSQQSPSIRRKRVETCNESVHIVRPSITTSSGSPEVAVLRRDHDRRRLNAALGQALGTRELLEARLAELDALRVVDRDHVDRVVAIVLQLDARAALRRAVNCATTGQARVLRLREKE